MSSLEAVGAALPEQGGKITAYVDVCIASEVFLKEQVLHEVRTQQNEEAWFLKIALLGRQEA